MSGTSKWLPRPRPSWVTALNATADGFGSDGARALVSIAADDLVNTACEVTGLDDFGGSLWREPFEILLRSLEDDAELHVLGRMMARTEILRALTNRLRIADALSLDPSIASERVDAPILVTGTGRSGTSLLLELLALHPELRAPLTWEMLEPTPVVADTAAGDAARIERVHRDVTFWNEVTPEYQSMHENSARHPNECLFMTQPTFVSDHWMGTYPVESYTNFLVMTDRRESFRYHADFLRLLQHGSTPRRWLLKAPSHLSQLPAFFREYPDATVVVTHRDPLRVLGSITDLMATLQWQKSDRVHYERIVKSVSVGTAIVFDLIAQWTADGTIPGDRVINVRYQDLVGDPLTTVRDVSSALGLNWSPQSESTAAGYLEAQRAHRHTPHEYAFGDTGLDYGETRARFTGYMERFDLREEVHE